jgi:hypothetical protein
MNTQVTDYINAAPTEQKQIMETVRELIHSTVHNTSEEFKWSRPVFKADKDFAYLKTAKAYVTLGFFNFEKIDDAQNKLEGTGIEMRHIKLKTMQDLDSTMLKKWLEAVAEN